MGARGKREAFSRRLWKTPLHVCTCSQPFPKRLSRPEFPAFSTIAAASIGHALQHKSDPPKQQENRFFYFAIQGGGLHYLWIWPGLSFLAVACAYFGLGPRVFGKRSDGTIASLALLALLPYFLFTWGIWHLARLFIKEDCYNRVVPGLYLGRRPLAHELPGNINAVVDLTAEFPEPKGVRNGRDYICAPTLDASVPVDGHFLELVERVTRLDGPTYVHCAQGHGRSGTLVAALLLARGTAKSVDEAIATVRKARPGVRLNAQQRALLARGPRRRDG